MPSARSPRTRLILPLAAFMTGLVALGIAAVLTLSPQGHGSAPSSVGGPFRLVSQDGRVVTERDYRGSPFLVFFGFTHCPDVCPTKLFELSEMLRALGSRGDKVRALFITVDPEQDTPEVMKSYVSSFDSRIIGLTGEREAIEAVTKAYRAYARKVPLKDGGYTMEHTALVYMMDREGRFIGSLNLERPAAQAAADLARYL